MSTRTRKIPVGAALMDPSFTVFSAGLTTPPEHPHYPITDNVAQSSIPTAEAPAPATNPGPLPVVWLALGLIAAALLLVLFRRPRHRRSSLRQSNEATLLRAIDGIDDGVYDWDLTNGLLYCSSRVAAMLNVKAIEAGDDFVDLLETQAHPGDRCLISHSLRHYLQFPEQQELSIEFRVFHDDNRIRWLSLKTRFARGDDDGSRRLYGSLSDVTTVYEQKQAIFRHAFHDALTGLPNRTLFAERLEQTLQTNGRDGHRITLLLLDINRFKYINDTLGHGAGDQLIKHLSDRLASAVRNDQYIARLGGDEFALLLPNSSEKHAKSVASRIAHSLKQPVQIDGHTLVVEASIGAALYPDHGENGRELQQHAEVAMYQAKQRSLTFAVYDRANDPNSMRLLSLENELRNAIYSDGLELHYQPKVSLGNNLIAGAEALIRWRHPTYGDVPPSEIIPLAEDSGLIRPLTRWVVNHALKQAAAWCARGVVVPIAVNISIRDIQDPDFVEFVEHAVRRSGLPAGALQVEITESVMMADLEHTILTVDRLSAMGVEIAIDDFGTGFSSLAYLKRFPVASVKIDKLFVTDMLDDHSGHSIVRSTVELAHNMGIRAVAEGVEDVDTLRDLTRMGCDLAQGHVIARPLPADDFLAWAANGPWRIPRLDKAQESQRERDAGNVEAG